MKGIFQTFYKKPKQRKVVELSDGVFIALYEDQTFDADMGVALQKAYRKYGETRNALVLDVGAHGNEPWMNDIMPGVLVTTTAHLGPYYLAPALSSVFEVVADAHDWLETGLKSGSQHIVIIIARNELSDQYRPLTAVALVACAYLTYVRVYENGVSALDHFKKLVKNAGLCSDRQIDQDISRVPTLYQYLRFFTMLRINTKFPNNRPMQMAKILVQGTVLIDDQPWNPIVRIFQAGRNEENQCTTIMQDDNGLGNDVMIGTGYASFATNEVITGDIIIAFEHWVPISDDTKPLFTIARHTGFLQPPYHRVLFKDVEMAPALASKFATADDFGVDLFFEYIDPPDNVDPEDFTEDALLAYEEQYGKEDADLIGHVADLYEIVEDIVTHAPEAPPQSLRAIVEPEAAAVHQSADFLEEIRQKNAEREKRTQERRNILEGRDSKRKAKLLEDVLGIDVAVDAVDEFMEVFKQYNDEILTDDQRDKISRQRTAKELLDKTFVARRTSGHQASELSSDDDGFGDIARYIDEEELDEMDVLRHKMSYSARETSQDEFSDEGEVDEEGEDDEANNERRDAEVLHNAVQVLLRGVKKTGRTDRFRADDVLAKSNTSSIDESEIIAQITGALQALVAESKDAGMDGSGRKFFSTQEVVDKVKVMRHEADPSAVKAPPPPPGLPALRKAPIAPGLAAPPPPPPPPPRPPHAPPTAGGGSKAPPPPPPPPGGAAKTPIPGGPKPPPMPKKGAGGPPPPPPPLGGLKNPAPPPPPMGKLRAPRQTDGSLTPKGPPGPPAGPPGAPPLVQTPKKNDTKRLNWNTISNMKVTKTLYGKQEFQDAASLDDDVQKDLLEKFSNRPLPKVFSDDAGDKATQEAAKGPRTAGILDQKRMTNTLIMLRKFTGSAKEITEAVRTLDPLGEKLSFDNVNALCVNEFKSEELEMAKNFAAPEEEVENLNPAEALAYHIARVPRWSMKVKTMLTMRTATEVEQEIRLSITTVIDASKEVLFSKRFERILAAILGIGNFLNAGTAKGSARGFRLEVLPKLSETKARDRGFNLLHYIADMLAKKDPDVLLFADDMRTVAKAKRVAKEDIARELTTFQRAVAVMGREITAMVKEQESKGGDHNVSLPSTPPPPKSARRNSNLSDSMLSSPALSAKLTPKAVPDAEVERLDTPEGTPRMDDASNTEKNALAVAKGMYTKAETAVSELQTLQEEMLRGFSKLAAHLGEDPKSAKVDEFFGTLDQFIQSFGQCVRDNKQRVEDVARAERLAKRHAEDQERRRIRSAEKAKASQGQQPDLSPVAVSPAKDATPDRTPISPNSPPIANSSEPNHITTPPR